MGIHAGTLNIRPLMELTYEARISRATQSRVLGKIESVKMWALVGSIVRCDIAPLTDEILYSQTGAAVVATHIVHFFSRQNVLPGDRIQFITNRRLAGPIGAWFEIMDRTEPSETLAYVRCHARLTDAPPNLIVPKVNV